MENVRKTHVLVDIGDGARRQYIDAEAAFTARESAAREAASVRGGMHWKSQNGREYLIRTSVTNSQKSLGPKSSETEAIYQKFVERKERLMNRLGSLTTCAASLVL